MLTRRGVPPGVAARMLSSGGTGGGGGGAAEGAKLVATNLDPNCPTQHGMRPGCGALVALLEVAAGVKAFSVGKPSPVMLRAARI